MAKLNESPVIFDNDAHTYTLNGVHLSGVTAIIKWLFPETYQDIPQSVLERAAEHGSLIHKKIEMFDKCGLGTETREVAEYARLKNEHGLTTVANEYLIDDDKHIASSIDIVFKEEDGVYSLADIKTTSKIHKDNVTLQLSIYAYLFERCNKGKKAGKLYVIWLPREQYGDPELMELQRIPTAGCKAIINAYIKREDDKRAELRSKYFTTSDSTEVELKEEALPASLKDAEDAIISLETEIKALEEKRKELKEGLHNLMIEHGVKKWQSDRLQLIRKLDGTRESVDTARLKKEYPDVYADCRKVSAVKGSITINII